MSGLKDVVEPREGFDKNKSFVNLPFFTRIINTPNLLGSPTSEGTHQDGVEFVMTTILKSSNVNFEGGAARTSLVKLEEPTGVPFDKVNPCLSKGINGRKQKCLQFLTPFSGTPFHANTLIGFMAYLHWQKFCWRQPRAG